MYLNFFHEKSYLFQKNIYLFQHKHYYIYKLYYL